jgi:hypothetical protein
VFIHVIPLQYLHFILFAGKAETGRCREFLERAKRAAEQVAPNPHELRDMFSEVNYILKLLISHFTNMLITYYLSVLVHVRLVNPGSSCDVNQVALPV